MTNYSFIFCEGSEDFVESGGDAERVRMFEGAEGDFRTGEGSIGSREIEGPHAVIRHARCYERLQCEFFYAAGDSGPGCKASTINGFCSSSCPI